MSEHSLLFRYREAIGFLLGRENYEHLSSVAYSATNFKLDRMQELLERLGNPQDKLKIVHIAGTKGKGSTAAMISSIATQNGYRTGLYTSPHLDRVEERFVVDQEPCSMAELVDLVAHVRPVVQAMDAPHSDLADGSGAAPSGPTYFDVTTALAMLYFVRRKVELAILEVGMGGRLDSTNVCQPLVTVITSISLDHTRQLGGTLAEIASEKAGIIKRGVPVISGVCEESAREVINRRAKKCRAPLVERGRDFDVCYHAAMVSGKSAARFDYLARSPAPVSRQQLTLGILGRHQAANAAAALAVVDVLREAGWHFGDEQVRRGLAEVRCRGRVELLKDKPLMVVDAAHNVASVHAFINALDEVGFSGPRSLVFATAKDKDIDGMLKLLLPRFDHVVFTRYMSNPRAEDPLQLVAKAACLSAADSQGDGQCWEVQEDPLAAFHAAQNRFGEQGAVCVTGSFYIAAEMRRLILQQNPPPAYAGRAELAFP